MLAWVWIAALLVFSAVGAYRLRAVRDERYARFVYICALGWASLPVPTGDWRWSLLFLPLALVTARLLVRRRGDHSGATRRSSNEALQPTGRGEHHV